MASLPGANAAAVNTCPWKSSRDERTRTPTRAAAAAASRQPRRAVGAAPRGPSWKKCGRRNSWACASLLRCNFFAQGYARVIWKSPCSSVRGCTHRGLKSQPVADCTTDWWECGTCSCRCPSCTSIVGQVGDRASPEGTSRLAWTPAPPRGLNGSPPYPNPDATWRSDIAETLQTPGGNKIFMSSCGANSRHLLAQPVFARCAGHVFSFVLRSRFLRALHLALEAISCLFGCFPMTWGFDDVVAKLCDTIDLLLGNDHRMGATTCVGGNFSACLGSPLPHDDPKCCGSHGSSDRNSRGRMFDRWMQHTLCRPWTELVQHLTRETNGHAAEHGCVHCLSCVRKAKFRRRRVFNLPEQGPSA